MGCRSIGRPISILHRQAQMYLNERLKTLDIGSSEHLFLMTLLRDGSMTQEELSAKIMIDKAATARAVKSLEVKGYVTRKADSLDKRAKKVTCTEKAFECKEQITEALKTWTEFLVSDLDEKTAEHLFTVLEQIAEKARGERFKELINKEKTLGSF